MKLTKVLIDDLTPHPLNYNVHTDAQLAELEKSLEQFEQYKNIVVCNGTIIAGHGLVEAARRKGMSEVFAVMRDDLTDDQQKALLISDNATPFGAEPDSERLTDILESIESEVNEIPGITDEWLKSILENDDDTAESKEVGETFLKSGHIIEIACNDETHQRELYERLTKEGLTCRVLTL